MALPRRAPHHCGPDCRRLHDRSIRMYGKYLLQLQNHLSTHLRFRFYFCAGFTYARSTYHAG